MSRAAAIVVVGVSLFVSSHAQEVSSNTELKIHPWVEESATVRVDKRVLEKLSIPSVTKDPSGTGKLVPTENFAAIFKLSGDELEKLTAAINGAVHEYRSAEASHCEPVEVPMALRVLAAAEPEDQRFSFQVKPFPEQAAEILKKLEQSVQEAIGEQRARYFWKDASLLDMELREASEQRTPSAEVRTRTYTFTFTAKKPGHVELHTRDEWRGPGGRGGGGEQREFPPALDRYAPEPLRARLAEWRKGLGTSGSAAADPPVNGEKSSIAGSHQEKWDDASPHAVVPKTVLNTIQLPGLTMEETLAPEIKGLLGLSEKEEKAVMALYGELKGKFERLERENFGRVAPDKNSFVIRAFRKESGILKQEWRERLAKELGRPRADLLDGAIQKGRTAFFRARNGRMLPGGMVDNGPSWLLRGLEETRLNFTVGERDGRPTLRYDFDMGDLGRGSGTARGGQIPKRWQHLVTPDMLNLPLAL